MKSIILTFALLILGSSAWAQFTFDCVDQKMQPAAQITIPAPSRFTYASQTVCNGGVGDPMICREDQIETEHKVASLKFPGSPHALQVQMPVSRTIVFGLPGKPWDDFNGKGHLKMGQDFAVELESEDPWSTYQYRITITPIVGTPVATTPAIPSRALLCRLHAGA